MASHRKPRSRSTARIIGAQSPAVGFTTAAVASVTLLSAQSAGAAPPADPAPAGKPSVEEVQRKVDDLYRQAGTAAGRRYQPGEDPDRLPRTVGTTPAEAPRTRTGASGPKAALPLPDGPGSAGYGTPPDRLGEPPRPMAAEYPAGRAEAATREGRPADARASLGTADARASLRTAKLSTRAKLAEARAVLSRLTAPERELPPPEPWREPARPVQGVSGTGPTLPNWTGTGPTLPNGTGTGPTLPNGTGTGAALPGGTGTGLALPGGTGTGVAGPAVSPATPATTVSATAPATVTATAPATVTVDAAGAAGAVTVDAVGAGGGSYAAKAEKVLAFARAQLGKPYVRGAAGPSSYDCSGLTQAAWKAAGVDLPRGAAGQAEAGRRVDAGELLPGDLLFFGDGRGHVGIYGGEGRVIHAPGPGAVVREDPVASLPFHGAVRPA